MLNSLLCSSVAACCSVFIAILASYVISRFRFRFKGALLLFFLIYTDFSVAVLAGGISLFLGIGRLIGYFYVPGYTSNNNRSSQMYPPRPPYNQQHMNFNEGFRQQSSQCPPPINDNMQNNKNN